MTNREEPIELLERALGQAKQVIGGVDPGQAGDPTPCEGMDVRELAQHLLSGVRRYAATVCRKPLPGPTTLAVGEDWAGQFADTATALLDGWRLPGAMESQYRSPVGELSGPDYLQLQLVEIVAHTWDLAQATGQHAALDGTIATAVLPIAERFVPADRRGKGSPFRPPVSVATDAPAYDRLAAFLGRQPWSVRHEG